MKFNERQELIDELLGMLSRRENDFPIIDEKGTVKFPVLNAAGIRTDWEEPMSTYYRFATGGILKAYKQPKGLKGYRGICVEINDHGNVSVLMCYKNGKTKEIASRV
jgi:hypothetical protein